MTLTRGARITGAALCGVLALITGAWIARDMSVTGGLADFWAQWSYDTRYHMRMSVLVSSPVDAVLVAVYAGTAVAALRSSAAAAALIATAVFTLAVRLPSLWVLTASWAYLQPTESLRARGLLSTFAVLGLAVGLVITALAGGRPAEADGRGAGFRAGAARPTTAVAWLAGALLLLDATVVTAWQIRFGYQVGPAVFVDNLVGGERVVQRLLAPPAGWLAATVVILCVTAGIGLLARAAFSRPLGLVLAAVVVVAGAVGVDTVLRYRLVENFELVSLERQLITVTSFFELIAGAALIVLLLMRGESRPADDSPPGAHRFPAGYGYGYPPAGPAYGYPGPSGGHGPPQGPPPPSSPPPNW